MELDQRHFLNPHFAIGVTKVDLFELQLTMQYDGIWRYSPMKNKQESFFDITYNSSILGRGTRDSIP